MRSEPIDGYMGSLLILFYCLLVKGASYALTCLDEANNRERVRSTGPMYYSTALTATHARSMPECSRAFVDVHP